MIRKLKYILKNELTIKRQRIDEYSNILNNPVDVGILTTFFYDADGKSIIRGGAERFLLELSILIRNNFNYCITIYQASNSFKVWGKKIEDNIDVLGLPINGKHKNLNFFYHRYVNPKQFTIYNLLNLAQPFFHPNNISISHGIYWDNPNLKDKDRLIKDFYLGLENSKYLVSVDTNTLNFFRSSFNSNRFNKKLIYVPNFVKCELFKPSKKKKMGESKKIVITYPRRLYEARGFFIFLQASEELLKKYNNLIINFIGEIHNGDISKFLVRLKNRYPKNIFHKVIDFNNMPHIYQESDIVVIPSLYSEGTSLSLLEAMACKCCVLSTNVGGLTNIIIDNFNGKLCNPDNYSIENALQELINDERKREFLSKNAYNTVTTAFNKKLWDEKWLEVIKMVKNNQSIINRQNQ